MIRRIFLTMLACFAATPLIAEDAATQVGAAYDLTARLLPGDLGRVTVSLQVGGELITADEKGKGVKLPLSVVATLAYSEQLLEWSPGNDPVARSLRRYDEAIATIKVDDGGAERHLPERDNLIVAAREGGRFVLNGLEEPLGRQEIDLINGIPDSLSLDLLLPNRQVREGDEWEHDVVAVAAVAGLDHVAMSDVRSTVVGVEKNQVKLKLSGTANGSVDGAATEVELRAAYLFHLDRGRITKFNVAIKEHRKPAAATPGLDVVAKASFAVKPAVRPTAEFTENQLERAAAASVAELRQLAFDSPERGCRFRHDDDWYVTGVQPDRLSLRLLHAGDLLAHCNIRTLPVRITADDQSVSLDEFEGDVRRSLGDQLGNIATATEWESPAGNLCLGVFADGEVNGVPMQWRNYLISEPGKPQISVSVTIERSNLELFADADRMLVDSLELLDKSVAKSAESASETQRK